MVKGEGVVDAMPVDDNGVLDRAVGAICGLLKVGSVGLPFFLPLLCIFLFLCFLSPVPYSIQPIEEW
jgi:hypothetical protein